MGGGGLVGDSVDEGATSTSARITPPTPPGARPPHVGAAAQPTDGMERDGTGRGRLVGDRFVGQQISTCTKPNVRLCLVFVVQFLSALWMTG